MSGDAGLSSSHTLDSHGRALQRAHPPLRWGRACRRQSRDMWRSDGMWSFVPYSYATCMAYGVLLDCFREKTRGCVNR